MDPTHLSLDDIRKHCRRKLWTPDHTLGDIHPSAQCLLDNGKHALLAETPLGQLDVLPPELIDLVLQALDIPSLTTFRRVNQRAMLLVDSLPPYRRIWASCPDILRAAVSINATAFSCATLFHVLTTTDKCESCRRFFGGFLYLITCQRVCYFCFTEKIEYFPVSLTLAAREGKVLKKALSGLPQVRCVPGVYTSRAKPVTYRVTLVDRTALLPMLSEEVAKLLNDRSDNGSSEPRRYMAIIPAPRLHWHEQQEADWGLHCLLCGHKPGIPYNPARNHRVQYSRDDILQHFRDYHASEVSK